MGAQKVTQLARQSDSITSSTPISESMAPPIRIAPLPIPELSDLSEPKWEVSVAHRLEAISLLREGWDGFGAGPIRRDVITFATHVLGQIMLPNTPAPHVTPMSHEGLMLEWHENGIELEIEIEKPGRLWISFEDSLENIDQEESVSSDLGKLAVPIVKLTKRSVIRA